MSVDGHLHGVSRSFWGGRALIVCLVLLALASVALTGSLTAPAQAAEAVEYNDSEIQFIQLLNDYRVDNGRQPLLVSDTLSLAAQRHSSDMGTYRFFNHYTKTYKSPWFGYDDAPWDRMWSSGYKDSYGNNIQTCMGENIAAGQMTALQAFTAFTKSPGHNAVMLSPDYTVVGIGQLYMNNGSYGYYWTTDFGGYADASAHTLPATYQQDHYRVNYLGTWYAGSNPSASGGGFAYTNREGAGAVITFKGTSIEWIGKKSPAYGTAMVSLDNGTPVPVALSSPTELYQQTLWSKDGLAYGTHTLIIYCASTDGCFINVDALKIKGALLPAVKPTRHQQNNTLLCYTGAYYGGWTWAASGGSFRYLDSPGVSVNVEFNGSYLAWLGMKSPVYGKAVVILDDREPAFVDLYSSATLYQQKVYETGILPKGPHTLSIYWVGETNVASSGTYINTDAFDVFGEITAAGPAPACPIPTTYQQNDPHISYVGGPWYNGWTTAASRGSFTYTGTKDSGALVNFSGTSVAWIGKKSPVYGKAWVQLDDQEPVVVDLYSEVEAYQQTLWSAEGLTDGPHTLAIKCLHDKREAAGGYYINIDALKINGVLSYLTRSEQNDCNIYYTQPWYGGWTHEASGGSFRYLNSPGVSINVEFDGSYLAWMAKKSSVYGKAVVRLDDQEPIIIDLYSAATLYQQRVYETGILPDGPHTLTIYWLGDKNPASSDTYINADAFDVLGELTPAGPSPACSMATTYEQNDYRITYLGGPWYNSWTSAASGGSFTYTDVGDSTALVDFNGTSVAWIGKKSPAYGKASVSLDGGEPVEVDLFGEVEAYQQTLWSAEGLTDGPHTLVIKCLHEMGDAAGGCFINIDAVKVTGVL